MEKKLIYTLRLIMFCTILYAAHISPLQRTMLREIDETVVNLTAQSIEGSVNAVRKKRVCTEDFFCLAEKSLSATNIPQLGTLCNMLDRYNNKTGHTTCGPTTQIRIPIKELLGQIHNCTVKALRNHTRKANNPTIVKDFSLK